MSTVVKTKFSMKPVVAAVALALGAADAYAITANQMPGAGLVTAVSTGATVNGGATGTAVINLVSSPTAAHVSLAGVLQPRAVIQWGGAGTAALGEATNPPGFNVGTGASMNFETAVGFGIGAVLNVDASGSISQILGTVRGDTIAGGSNGFTAIYVANANGITVGSSGRIIAPWGVALIGADMTGSTAKYDFTRQNGAATSFLSVPATSGTVSVNGIVNGDATANIPANYVLLVGGNVNVGATGNIFGAQVAIDAGLVAAPTTDTVNGVAKTTVNRLWNLDNNFGYTAVNGNLGTAAGNIAISTAGGSFVNLGTISSSNNKAPTAEPSYIGIAAAGSITSGTLGDTNQLVGLFSDGGIVTDTFSAAGVTSLFNVVEAYTIGNTLPFLNVNQQVKAAGDVVINAIVAGSNPSSITTTGGVNIFGGAIAINSTINHKTNAAGGKQGEVDLNITGTKSISITGDVGAGGNVNIYLVPAAGQPGGNISISGNVLSDQNASGYGGIYVFNYSPAAGATTTISGNLSTNAKSYSSISVYNLGGPTSKLIIGGNITSHNNTDIFIVSLGEYLQTGKITAGADVDMTVLGFASSIQGPVTAGNEAFGTLSYAAPFATTKLYPAAVLTGNVVEVGYDNFNGAWNGTGIFTGVNATGVPYATSAQKPAAQIVTDNLVLDLLGSFNAPLSAAGNPQNNFLLNSLTVAPLTATVPTAVSISAVGAGFQAINVALTGTSGAFIDSGITFTPFVGVPLTTGFFPAGGLIGNGGSQLIINATGQLSLVSNSGAQGAGEDGGPGFFNGGGNAQFQFPGGAVFKSATGISQFVPVYNAWTTIAQPYQGIFYEAPAGTINALSFDATNGNSWVNFSTMPVNGSPTVYQIAQNSVPPVLPTAFGFRLAPEAVHQNTYSLEVVGGVVNTCPVIICGWKP